MTSTKGIIIGGVKKIKEITSSEAILELENTPLKIKGNNLALVKRYVNMLISMYLM